MIWQHLVWWGLTMGSIAWYCTITVYVAIKGASDITEMLKKLRPNKEESSGRKP
jgi:hypothetical protein